MANKKPQAGKPSPLPCGFIEGEETMRGSYECLYEIREDEGRGMTIAYAIDADNAVKITAAVNAHAGLVRLNADLTQKLNDFCEAWESESTCHLEQAYRDARGALLSAAESRAAGEEV